MPLTANRDLDHYVDQELRTFRLAADAHVRKGAFVGLTAAGFARPLVAGDPFVGIAYEHRDNTDGENGDESVRVYTLGDFGHALAGAAIASIGRPVFASDDETLTFSAPGNSFVGFARDVPASGEIILRLDTGCRSVKTVAFQVENLAAGADITSRAIHAFNTQAWIVAARIVNHETAAAGIDDGNTCVITLSTAAGTVAAATFNTAATFPAVNTAHNLGAITNPRAAAGAVLLLAVVNGTTADPGPFTVEIDYV